MRLALMSARTSASTILLLLVTLCVLPCASMIMTGRPGYGFVGYGIVMYNPVCPYACRGVLSASKLSCSTTMVMDGSPMVDTSTTCYATDTDFLSSMAWCIKSRCTNMELWQIEKWWNHEIPGKQVGQRDPKWTYQETLDRNTTPPITTIRQGDPLNTTVMITQHTYELQATTLWAFTEVEVNHSKYGLVLLISSVIIPIAASLLRFLPIPKLFKAKIYASLVNQAFISPRGGQLGRFISPDLTRGQALFVTYLLIVNIVLCIVGYPVVYPNAWWTTRSRQILTYVTNRAGVLSFANIPVLVLYAGRNNLLLWLTNWDYSTFIVLHSWVAFISTIQAILHSLIYLRIYVHLGTHNTESKLPYWYYGIIATVGMSVLLPASISKIRRKVYEIFLASHFAIALISLVGCYLHIFYKFGHQWGYELWIYLAFAIWGFDRLFRLLRMARTGVRTADISVIDEDYLRVEIDGLVGEGSAYLYFPTLTWRVWENHPFSVFTNFIVKPMQTYPVDDSENNAEDLEGKGGTIASTRRTDRAESSPRDVSASMTFFIRTCHGVTSLLSQHSKLPVLVETGYPISHDVPAASTLICIAGGVGITAVIPVLEAHRGRRKLYWSCRSQRLVDAIEPFVEDAEMDVVVGGRCDVESVLQTEIARGGGEIVMFVSGPEGMMHDTRNTVCRLAVKSHRPVRLICTPFSW
ncbi:Ferric/cupric reductase transmembrane component B [Pseudocercospora fuligena]|uniref:Ferric/cupric reductase transmembrane component B n=1 Tax=Pseudocercospora fuligena TaxID=685502 RepID=A0A8H6VLC0_9PEZI|nr:Ferric/cupric reductase transmembrane component B [Pseudocercospora fuligena]